MIETSPVSPTILQEHTNTGKPKPTRTEDPRPSRGRNRCRSEALIAGERTGASAGWCGFLRLLFGWSKRGCPWPEPEGQGYGMSLQADRGDQQLDGTRVDGTGKDTFADPHIASAHRI